MTLTPDHWLVRRAEMILWLDGIKSCIEDQAPESVRKQRALKQLDGWLEDLPTYAMIEQ
jgi:hypothetical protein